MNTPDSFFPAYTDVGTRREKTPRAVRASAVVWFDSAAYGARDDVEVVARLSTVEWVWARAGDLRRALGIPEPGATTS